LSYLFDIYREEELNPSLLEFGLYMAFWPTVFSGPVCRLPNMLPQFRQAAHLTWDNISAGARRVIQGLIMKFVLAQILASGLSPGEGVTAGFDRIQEGWGGIDVWLLAIGFGFQLFFDFAGYSHIVIGAARIFGIRLEENFDRPYFSTTPSAFWTRWHMSLSFWIRDYLFLPLAALRRERAWPYLALILSMTLFGLWHAAKLTFIVWGVYHGLLLVAHRLGQQTKRRLSFKGPSHLGPLLSWAATFSFVSLGWIFFRANDLDQAFTMLRSAFLPGHYHRLAMPANFYIVTGLVLAGYFIYATLAPFLVHWRLRYRQTVMNNMQGTVQPLPDLRGLGAMTIELLAGKMWWWVTPFAVMLLGLGGLAIFGGSPTSAFIYTNF
jgi:alginate O-acetyltransferase complex protein AlgI